MLKKNLLPIIFISWLICELIAWIIAGKLFGWWSMLIIPLGIIAGILAAYLQKQVFMEQLKAKNPEEVLYSQVINSFVPVLLMLPFWLSKIFAALLFNPAVKARFTTLFGSLISIDSIIDIAKNQANGVNPSNIVIDGDVVKNNASSKISGQINASSANDE